MNRRGCPLCDRPIRQGRLMCRLHWSLVPPALQAEVTASWRALRRALRRRQRDIADLGRLLATYRTAAKAAEAAVAALAEPTS